jgi:hypothetical protein
MRDARGLARAERADRIEAQQCKQCARWFTTRGGYRSPLCFKCEEGQQAKQ